MVAIEVNKGTKEGIEGFKKFIEEREGKIFSIDETILICIGLARAAFEFAKEVNIKIEE